MDAVASVYEAIPAYQPADGSRAEVLRAILRGVCGVESVFSDYQPACEERCFVGKEVAEMCELCQTRMRTVAGSLLQPDSFAWEVWKEGEIAGVIRFSRVRPGEDAKAHYVFFDGDLRGKTGVMRDVIAWAFRDHAEYGWQKLRRITIEVPDFAFALARHASRKLGFGGPFKYKLPEGGPTIQVEGMKPKGVVWRGERRDVLVLGLENDAA